MDQHGGDGGGGRSSSRLRDRLARMFRPGTLLRSACNTTASASTGTGTTSANSRPPPASAFSSSSRALLAADADSVSFLASSRRDHAAAVGRTESFSTAVDRLHRRGAAVAPAPPPSRFSVDNQPPPPPPPLLETNKEKTDKSPRDRLMIRNDKTPKTVKMLSNDPYGFSTSEDNDTDDDVFSSDAEDLAGVRGGAKKLAAGETTSFFSSSRSFSSDSSEFYTTKKNKTTKASKITARTSFPAAPAPPPPKPPLPPSSRAKSKEQQRRHRRVASSCDTCGVRDGFRPAVVSAAEEQLRKGFAVVKRSRDPYADFRSSMVEMIVGRQLFGAPDLERLLRSYLSLNAPRHHPVILQAFSDIWVVLHGG